MNQLSWLIYLADVANSAEGWFSFFGWFFFVLCVLTLIIMAFVHINVGNEFTEKGARNSPEHIAEQLAAKKRFGKVAWGIVGWAFPLWIVGVTATVVIPSKDTVYAIAASELGERALQTPLVGKMGMALEAWLDRQIQPRPQSKSEADDVAS